ncbi:hypothetical protein [Vibrio injensis]|uniref:hypothetical protein n=1 Tax=Vibrio injensis TaxID=1307414 RepID=UPI000934C548|nr:hypothetical protein [Vibrio injensis]
MPDLSLYKVDLDTPQPDGPNGEKRRGESPRAAFTKYNEALEEIEGGFVPAEAGKGLSTNDYDNTARASVEGMGTAASRHVANFSNININHLVPVGFAGLGTNPVSFNNFNDPTLYPASNTVTYINIQHGSSFNPANKPPSAANWWFMKVHGRLTGGSYWNYSVLVEDINGNKFTRTVSRDTSTDTITFGRWILIYSQTNSVSNVSQVEGIPTGGLMQYGQTPNGVFLRFAANVQICLTTINVTTTEQESNVYGSTAGVMQKAIGINLSYPAPFASPPKVTANAVGNRARNASVWARTATAYNYSAYSNGATQDSFSIDITAIGPWY